MRNLSILLLLPLGLALSIGGTGCTEASNAAGPSADLIDDAAAMAALADGDGEDLSTAMAAMSMDDAVMEDVDVELLEEDDMARACRFIDFRRRVIAEYDTDEDGELDRDERYALRDDLAAPPFRLRKHGRHYRLKRLKWIYDADDSGALDPAERDELRGDLELRCMNREAWLIERYDENGDGELDDDEFGDAVDALVERRQTRRAAFVDQYDENEDGRVDYFERVQARIDRLERILDRHDAAIDEYDVDGDGTLSTDERAPLREKLKARVRGEHFGDDPLGDGEDDDSEESVE